VCNPETDTWTPIIPILTPRSVFGVAVISNEIYAFGDRTHENIIGGLDVYIYFIENEKYSSMIIAEFPSWLILPLFLTVTFSVIVLKKMLTSKQIKKEKCIVMHINALLCCIPL
jgi:hypothetical protein